MTTHEKVEKLKKIARLEVKVDSGIKWVIENYSKESIWVEAYKEGFMYAEKIHADALENKEVAECI